MAVKGHKLCCPTATYGGERLLRHKSIVASVIEHSDATHDSAAVERKEESRLGVLVKRMTGGIELGTGLAHEWRHPQLALTVEPEGEFDVAAHVTPVGEIKTMDVHVKS